MTLLFVALLVRDWVIAIPRASEIPWGADYDTYMAATHRWLAGDGLYPTYQIAGPYEVSIENAPVLYPPTAFLLFAPFTVLPALLWWVIPIGISATVIVWHRPALTAWPAIAAGLWFPTTSHMIVTGNPGLWAVAALALGTVWGWPAVGVLLKPSLAPFALWGANRRNWWIALALAVVVSLLMLPLWIDYASVLVNARANTGPFYSIDQVPTMLMVIAARLGSSARSFSRPAQGVGPSVLDPEAPASPDQPEGLRPA